MSSQGVVANQSAFPSPSGASGNPGMTYREWLAGQIVGHVGLEIRGPEPEYQARIDSRADLAVRLADALIARLARS